MSKIMKFGDFILEEKTIGSENIRAKWYPDIDKSIFYKLVNIDPTSIRKKDFSKPGKYTKWLISEHKKKNLWLSELDDEEYSKKLKYYLFVFSTGWYANRFKGTQRSDINFYHLKSNILTKDFFYMVDQTIDAYEAETEDSKFDVVYSDDKISILVPINFTSSRETAKNTEWCSQSLMGYSQWNRISIMFRIIPKSKSYDKLKLTWKKDNGPWYMACSKYPEIQGNGYPFKKENPENWQNMLDQHDAIYKRARNLNVGASERWKENSENKAKTMSLVSDEAKKYIEDYYNQHKKSTSNG